MKLIFHCTQKMLKEVGGESSCVALGEEESARALKFYVNLVRFGRVKCALITHAETLFSVIAPRVTRADLRDLAGLTKSLLLNSGDLLATRLAGLLEKVDGTVVTRTVSRSVLGSMMNMKSLCDYEVERWGGVENTSWREVVDFLNRTPFLTLKHVFPVEMLKEYLKTAA